MTSSRLPAAVGPYSLGRLIPLSDGSAIAFSSGQLGIDPVTNNLVSEDVAEQAEQAFKNLKNLMEDNGMNIATDAVRNTLYLVDMNDFARVNEVYGRYFGGGADYPARTTVAVKALPKGAKIEIDSIIFKPK